MATATTTTLAPGLPTDYYAPDYKVLVNGLALHPDTKGDVLEVKVVMDIDNLTSFEMTVNNWDDETLDFKYSDSHTFDAGVPVEVLMGYANRLVSMVKGQITALTPQFPASGPPTLSISGLDAMFLLRDRKPLPGDRKIFVNMADWEIAQVIAARNQLQLKATQTGEKHDQVVQKNQDDAQFLMERAKRIDYDCYIANDPITQQATLNFTAPTDSRGPEGDLLPVHLGYEPDQLQSSVDALEAGQPGDRAGLGPEDEAGDHRDRQALRLARRRRRQQRAICGRGELPEQTGCRG